MEDLVKLIEDFSLAAVAALGILTALLLPLIALLKRKWL